MGKDNFLLPKGKYRSIQHMNDDEAGKLFKAVYCYAVTGEPDTREIFGDRFLCTAFEEIKDYIDSNEERYKERCEVNRENGKKGGRPPKIEE
ncbi:MAG: hypothetical protein IJT44_07470 [Clostridia bacterium]|nr:hypothetical protein [Clostridia bacterium]